MNRRIMFVDDEVNILEGLRHRLHKQRRKWDMLFVRSGKEALEVLAREPVDVIVSDMRMPEMDGAVLLKKVQDEYPRVVRVVLSGHAEAETAMRAVHVAHQFLTKPSEPGAIEEVVERACGLQLLICEDVLKRVVGRIDRLPPVPRLYRELTVALSREDVSVEQVASILQQDMAMSAKMLQIVNSSFFRLSRTISKVEEAVTYLGFNTLKQIVLSVEVFQSGKPTAQAAGAIEALQSHALLVASVASSLFTGRRDKDNVFVCGLLHDIGKMVVTVELPDLAAKVQAEMQAQKCTMHAAEQRVYGVTHAEIGAYLLGLWGLPYPIIEAVANHHAPGRVPTSEFGILAATHVANALVHDILEPGPDGGASSVDAAFLDRLRLSEKLPVWQESARKQVASRISAAT